MKPTLSSSVQTILKNSTSKALATEYAGQCNVVPVSTIRVLPEEIWLFDFFMEKTTSNIKHNPQVALTAWTGTTGVQIYATASYQTKGDNFEAAIAFSPVIDSKRVVRGVLILSPTKIFDISPTRVLNKADLTLFSETNE